MSLWFHRNMPPVPSGVFRHFLFVSDYWFFLLIMALFLRVGSRIFFLILKFLGVTSRSSSVSMKSRHCSRLMSLGGVSLRASSELEERVLVSFFV